MLRQRACRLEPCAALRTVPEVQHARPCRPGQPGHAAFTHISSTTDCLQVFSALDRAERKLGFCHADLGAGLGCHVEGGGWSWAVYQAGWIVPWNGMHAEQGCPVTRWALPLSLFSALRPLLQACATSWNIIPR